LTSEADFCVSTYDMAYLTLKYSTSNNQNKLSAKRYVETQSIPNCHIDKPDWKTDTLDSKYDKKEEWCKLSD